MAMCNECEAAKIDNEMRKLKMSVAGYKGQVKLLQKRVYELNARLVNMTEQNHNLLEDLRESNSMCTTYRAEIEYLKALPWYRRIFNF